MGLRPSRKSVDVEVCVQTSSIQTYQTTNIASANQQAQRWAHVHASNAARQEKRTGKKKGKNARNGERKITMCLNTFGPSPALDGWHEVEH